MFGGQSAVQRRAIPDHGAQRGATHELAQRVLEIEPRAVGGVMVELGVGQHGDLRIQAQQRAVRLVGLDHDPLALSPAGVGAGPPQLAAHHVGRIEPAFLEDLHDHRGGGGLAVGPGHGQAALDRGDLSQQLGAVQLASGGGHALRVLGRNRRRVHDLRAGRDVLGPVAEHGLDPPLAQDLGVARVGTVGARHARTQPIGDQGQPAHAGPADADEVKLAVRPVHPGRSRAPGRTHSSRSSTTTGMSRSVLRWYSS